MTFELDDEMRRTMGKLDRRLNLGMGGRSLMVWRVIFGERCLDCCGGLLAESKEAGVGGVMIVLIFVCIPLPFMRKVVDTFLVASNFDLAAALCGSDFSFCGHSKVKRVVSLAETGR